MHNLHRAADILCKASGHLHLPYASRSVVHTRVAGYCAAVIHFNRLTNLPGAFCRDLAE